MCCFFLGRSACAQDSLSQTAIAQPPICRYSILTQGFAAIKAALAELHSIISGFWSPTILCVFLFEELVVAAVSTAILLVIGYPIASAWHGCRSAGRRSR